MPDSLAMAKSHCRRLSVSQVGTVARGSAHSMEEPLNIENRVYDDPQLCECGSLVISKDLLVLAIDVIILAVFCLGSSTAP